MILLLLNLVVGSAVGWAGRCLFERTFNERDAWALGVLAVLILVLGTIVGRQTP